MSLRPHELEQVVDELRAGLVGAIVQKAWAPLPRLGYLELRKPGRSILLCLSAEPTVARLSVAERRLPGGAEPAALQRVLRERLTGHRLVAIEQEDGQRARLSFEGKDAPAYQLLLDLSSAARLVLLDASLRELFSDPPRSPDDELPKPRPSSSDDAPRASRLLPASDAAVFPLACAAEALFGARELDRRLDAIRRVQLAPLRAQLSRLGRSLSKVEADAARAPEAERHKLLGELLVQNLHRIAKGQREVTLTRYGEAGPEEVTVRLDPTRSPKDEAAWHFHQYRRLLRGIEHAARRKGELDLERERLEGRIAALEAATPEELLERAPAVSAKRGPARASVYKEYVATGGARIWVGKNAQSNDALTFHHARPNDVWLHARGVPGSHVVLRVEKGQPADPQALIDAALLAHHHSQNKGEPRGEVVATEAKFVRRQKGGAPGQVTFTREKSLVVRVEPERLSRLLKSQRDGAEP